MTNDSNDTDDEASIAPEIVFNGVANAEGLEPLPEGSSIEIRGPDGTSLAEIDTDDVGVHAFFDEDQLTGPEGNSETVRTFHISHQSGE